MAIIKEETTIKNLKDIINNYSLKIPDFQRPYLWSRNSVQQLFDDIEQAYNNEKIQEYRLGTIILYKKKDKNDIYIYDIVDGQQRLITLALLINNLDNNLEYLLNEEINTASNQCIIDNYNLLEEILKNNKNKDELLKFILENCTLGVIVTNQQEEAFQFFDSQNARGKTLAPHDLLKAYHLREMKNKKETTNTIEYCVEKWENIEEIELKVLFADYLFTIKLWSKGQNKRNFTRDDIYIYEGISEEKKYNYILHRIQNINVKNESKNVFQINEEIFSGKYFFYYIFNYNELLSNIDKRIKERQDLIILNKQPYINTMFYCALMLFADRFNLEELDKKIKVIYRWSYGLRISMMRVDRQVINKYVTGRYGGKIGCGSFFEIINEMNDPDNILKHNIKIDYKKHNKYNGIRAILNK